jgi:hypothetical protein
MGDLMGNRPDRLSNSAVGGEVEDHSKSQNLGYYDRFECKRSSRRLIGRVGSVRLVRTNDIRNAVLDSLETKLNYCER